MKMRLVSDLHLNFSNGYTLEKSPDEANTILVIAGDSVELGYGKKELFQQFLETHAPRFKRILFVLGNHCYWGLSLEGAVNVARKIAKAFDNVTLLQNDALPFPDEKILFVGGTLWTSLHNMDPIVVMDCRRYMNDFWEIERMDPERWKKEHDITKFIIDRYLNPVEFPEYKDFVKVVVTHHAPHYNSIGTEYRGPEHGNINYAYHTDLTALMENREPHLWVHGHIHEAMRYEIGRTIVQSNPRGYTRIINGWAYNSGFNPTLVIDLEQLKREKESE